MARVVEKLQLLSPCLFCSFSLFFCFFSSMLSFLTAFFALLSTLVLPRLFSYQGQGLMFSFEVADLPNLSLFEWISAWSIMFLFVSLLLHPFNFSFDFKNRVVSMVHAFVVAFLGVTLLFTHPIEFGQENTPSQTYILNLSCGYFLYDTFSVATYEIMKGKFDWAAFAHHVATLMGLGYGLYSNRSGGELGITVFAMEVSNPFMHLVHMLREVGLRKAFIGKVNDYLFALSFFLTRMIFGTWSYYYTVMSPTTDIVIKVGASLLLLVSYFWFYKICSIFFRPKNKDSKNGKKKKE